MNKILFALVFTIYVSLLFTSCKKGDGGPAGPAGAAGAIGPVGPLGATGAAGNANVQAILFSAPAWSGTQINISVPQNTADVYTSGVVLAYMEFASIGNVYYHVPGFVVNATYQVRVYTSTGTMRFNLLNPDGTTPGGTAPALSKIKVIIIPSSSTTTGKSAIFGQDSILNSLKAANVDVNNYNDVAAHYGIAASF